MGKHAAIPRVGWMPGGSAIASAAFALLMVMLDPRRAPGRRRAPRGYRPPAEPVRPAAHRRRPSPGPAHRPLTEVTATQ